MRSQVQARRHELTEGDRSPERQVVLLAAPAGGLRRQLDAAIAQIHVLDRLRPTCVICHDTTADRQTVRGPECSDCVGALPDDGPDPDRMETWAFPGPEEFGPGPETSDDHGEPEHGPAAMRRFMREHPLSPGDYVHRSARCAETGDGMHTGGWHDGGQCDACGLYGPDPDEASDAVTPSPWGHPEPPRADDPDEPTNRELEPEPPGWHDVADPEEGQS